MDEKEKYEMRKNMRNTFIALFITAMFFWGLYWLTVADKPMHIGRFIMFLFFCIVCPCIGAMIEKDYAYSQHEYKVKDEAKKKQNIEELKRQKVRYRTQITINQEKIKRYKGDIDDFCKLCEEVRDTKSIERCEAEVEKLEKENATLEEGIRLINSLIEGK
jgi:hypothetical protein